MWLFLVTEVLLFGGLFVGYAIMHAKHPEVFMQAHHHLSRPLGTLNTVVLLVSSFTMVMAVWSAQTSKRKLLILFLSLTLLLACVFLVVKGFEYNHKFEEGAAAGQVLHASGRHRARSVHVFQFLLHDDRSARHPCARRHGRHLVAAPARAPRRFLPLYFGPVDLVGLYWHLVDMIWIYLFPLMYLIS